MDCHLTSKKEGHDLYFLVAPLSALLVFLLLFSGCANRVPVAGVPGNVKPFPTGTIIDTATGQKISFEEMMENLSAVRVVYVGESHTNIRHHEIQLEILKGLNSLRPDIIVGMEMFAQPYQEVLSHWVEGRLSEDEFLKQTHWYANWRFDFSLYREQLVYIREHGIPLVGLNIEFHIPSKIAAGGIDSLLPYQKEQVPDHIDLSNVDHREYVRGVYEKHAEHITARYEFENFYAAQVVWDEAMAEAISRYLKGRVIVVFAGKGHIIYDFGIPSRAYTRTGVEYRTVIPVAAGEPIDFSIADYLWVTDSSSGHGHFSDIH